jgi:hypothetical protein
MILQFLILRFYFLNIIKLAILNKLNSLDYSDVTPRLDYATHLLWLD